MLTLRTAVVLSVATLAILTQACTLASPTEVTMVPVSEQDSTTDGPKAGSNSTSAPKSGGTPSAGGSCAASAKFIKPDLATLTACGNGKGHCALKTNMTEPMQQFFGPDTCKGGEVCVDDGFIKAGGNELKTCKSSLVQDGRCVVMELNAPMVADGRAVALKSVPSECDAGAICAPCTDVTNNGADTGFCHPMGLTEAACTTGGATPAGGADATPAKAPAAPAAECCGGKGQCMLKSGMPNGSGDSLEKDTCKDANVCAPKAMVAGKATKCKAMLMAGICVGSCFNGMLDKVSDIGLLRQGDCAEEESCVPCFAVKQFMAGEGVPVPGCE